ncbi:MAG: PH domain-containing protein [Aquiluna sp.]
MQVFRSRSGRAIALASVIIMTLAWFVILIGEGLAIALISLPGVALIAMSSLLLFWFPRVEVSEERVKIVNVFREHDIGWGAIKLIDTRWALAITTDKGKITAWGAPAPGRHSSIFASRDQGQHLPESTYIAGTVRPGDLVSSDSGAAAAHIRRLWEQRRDQVATVESKWSIGKIAAIIALVFATALSL